MIDKTAWCKRMRYDGGWETICRVDETGKTRLPWNMEGGETRVLPVVSVYHLTVQLSLEEGEAPSLGCAHLESSGFLYVPLKVWKAAGIVPGDAWISPLPMSSALYLLWRAGA